MLGWEQHHLHWLPIFTYNDDDDDDNDMACVWTCCDILGVGSLHLAILFLTFEILSLFKRRIRYELNYCVGR